MAMESWSGERFGGTLGLTRYYGTAAPSLATDVGPFKVGDEVINVAPAGGGATYRSWVCVTAGATGATSAWKGFGLIEA